MKLKLNKAEKVALILAAHKGELDTHNETIRELSNKITGAKSITVEEAAQQIYNLERDL